MKLIYCIPSLHNSGGIERVITQKANYFSSAMGWNVTIVTTDLKGRKPYFKLDSNIKIRDLSINYSDLDNSNFIIKAFGRIGKQRLHLKRLSNVLFEEKADITISVFSHELSLLPKIKDGSKKIVELHFSKDFRKLHNKANNVGALHNLIAEIQDKENLNEVKLYDKLVLLTNEDREAWDKDINCCVIPNFITEDFTAGRTAELKNKTVVAAGRLCPQKGFDLLLEAWAKTIRNEKAKDWTLNIYGSGPDENELKNLAHNLGITDSVHFHEPTKHIDEILLDSSIFCLPSRYEGMPMMLTESMSLGLPCVSFACPCGPKDLLGKDNERGSLIPNFDINNFASSLIDLISDYNLRLTKGTNAKNYIINNLTQSQVMKKWIDLFNSI